MAWLIRLCEYLCRISGLGAPERTVLRARAWIFLRKEDVYDGSGNYFGFGDGVGDC